MSDQINKLIELKKEFIATLDDSEEIDYYTTERQLGEDFIRLFIDYIQDYIKTQEAIEFLELAGYTVIKPGDFENVLQGNEE